VGQAFLARENKELGEKPEEIRQNMKEIFKQQAGPYQLDLNIGKTKPPAAPGIFYRTWNWATGGEKGAAAPVGFKELPPAAGYKGQHFKDTKTGQRYQSDGSSWVPVK